MFVFQALFYYHPSILKPKKSVKLFPSFLMDLPYLIFFFNSVFRSLYHCFTHSLITNSTSRTHRDVAKEFPKCSKLTISVKPNPTIPAQDLLAQTPLSRVLPELWTNKWVFLSLAHFCSSLNVQLDAGMFLPDLKVKMWVKTPPGTQGAARALPHTGHTKGSQTLPAALIFGLGWFPPREGWPTRTKSGLGAKDCAQKAAGNGFSHSLWVHSQSPRLALGFYWLVWGFFLCPHISQPA